MSALMQKAISNPIIGSAYYRSESADVTHCEMCGVLRTEWERDRQLFPLCWHCDQIFLQDTWDEQQRITDEVCRGLTLADARATGSEAAQ